MHDDALALAAQTAALRESEARLALATSAAGLGVWEWRLDSNEMVYSRRACEIYGFDPDAPVTYDIVAAATHPEDRVWTAEKARRAVDPTVRDRTPYEYRIVRPDGVVRTVFAQGEALFEPGDEGPRAVRYIGTIADVTERRGIEAELRRSEVTLKLALEAARMAVWQYDVASSSVVLNPGLTQLLGFDPDANTNMEDVGARFHPDDMKLVREAGQRAAAAGEDYFETEFRCLWPGGEVRWFMVRAQITRDESGRRGALGILMDINERKIAEQRLHLLAREVDHRANNLLTVVQSTIALSDASSAEDLKEVLSGRVFALALAHQLLAEGRWEGADLRRIVEEEVRPYVLGDARSRVSLEGPQVALTPQNAQSVGMAIHELATNAAKYGALSTPNGLVRVTWHLSDHGAELALQWEEAGGPQVLPPSRRGLGMTMLERAFVSNGGVTAFEWRPSGLVCRLHVALVKSEAG
jgi:PAS domain S-box-containing protein